MNDETAPHQPIEPTPTPASDTPAGSAARPPADDTTVAAAESAPTTPGRRWRDRTLGFRGAIAVALAGLILGAAGGAAGMALGGDGEGHRDQGRDQGHGRGHDRAWPGDRGQFPPGVPPDQRDDDR